MINFKHQPVSILIFRKEKILKYKAIYIECKICGKECKGLIGLSSHISQTKNHPTFNDYMEMYPIDDYIFEQMKDIFLKSFDKVENGCWLWNGYISHDGYGKLYAFGRRISSHRFSYELFKSKIFNKDLCVCHSCDTPECVNPDHLWLGTSKENTKDSVDKGRRDYLKGETNPAKSPEVRKKISEKLKGKPRPSMIGNKNNKSMFGDDNPMRNPEVSKKCQESRKRNKKNDI